MKSKLLLSLIATGSIFFIVSSCQSDNDLIYNRYYTSGSLLYHNHCENCHGINGEGLANLIPPLRDSVYLRKNLARLPCFVENGLKDPVMVSNKTFTGQAMPAQDNLSAIEIAEILTYVTNSFGNKAGLLDAAKVNSDLAACN